MTPALWPPIAILAILCTLAMLGAGMAGGFLVHWLYQRERARRLEEERQAEAALAARVTQMAGAYTRNVLEGVYKGVKQ